MKIREITVKELKENPAFDSDVLVKGDTLRIDGGELGKFLIVREDKLADVVSEILERARVSSAEMLGLDYKPVR